MRPDETKIIGSGRLEVKQQHSNIGKYQCWVAFTCSIQKTTINWNYLIHLSIQFIEVLWKSSYTNTKAVTHIDRHQHHNL